MISASVLAIGWLLLGALNAFSAGRNIQIKDSGWAGVNIFMAGISLLYVARYVFQ